MAAEAVAGDHVQEQDEHSRESNRIDARELAEVVYKFHHKEQRTFDNVLDPILAGVQRLGRANRCLHASTLLFAGEEVLGHGLVDAGASGLALEQVGEEEPGVVDRFAENAGLVVAGALGDLGVVRAEDSAEDLFLVVVERRVHLVEVVVSASH